MKRLAKGLWTAGVLAGILTGVQTLSASPAVGAEGEQCFSCHSHSDGTLHCVPTICPV